MKTKELNKPVGFYAKSVLGILEKMNLGRMHITFSDGTSKSIGKGEGGVEADIRIESDEFYKRCVLYGDVGFGEAYVDGLWNTSSITNVIKWFLLNIENAPGVSGSSVQSLVLNILKGVNTLSHLRRANSVKGSKRNIVEHYDLSNDFFSLWLDPSMTYSSAYFKTPDLSLENAQYEKYRRLSEQLHLRASDHVLEIGSGWGANAIFMAENYGCKVTSVTISEEQCKLANERVKAKGLADRVKVIIEDYRNIKGQFDKIVSVEMLEAVGAEYYEPYFLKCHEVLKKDGIVALQVITCPDSRFEQLKNGVDWIQKHIFPGSLLPSVAALNHAVNTTGDLTLVDLKDLGLHYARTLHTWFDNFNAKRKEILELGFDDRFTRKWNYYLCYCEAAFAMRNINVMQMIYSRPNNTTR
jgi:cyclopropane-fatty-acyl-phospholipid synthase